MNEEILLQLNNLAKRQRELEQETEKWYIDNLKHFIDKCSTIEELNDLFGDIVIVDENNQIKDLPHPVGIFKAFAYDRILFGR